MESGGEKGPEKFVLPAGWYQKSYNPETDVVVFAHRMHPGVELAVQDLLMATNPGATLAKLQELEAQAANADLEAEAAAQRQAAGRDVFERAPLVVFGAGGHAKVVIEVCVMNGVQPTMILDDSPGGRKIFGSEVRRAAEVDWRVFGPFRFIVAIGDNGARRNRFAEMMELGGRGMAASHPSAIVSRSAKIGAGSVVMAGAIVNPGAVIGENCIINTGARVDHDCIIGANAHIAPGAILTGGVIVGENAFVGAGSICAAGTKIEANVALKPGSVVLR